MDGTTLVERFYTEAATGHPEILAELFTGDFVAHSRPGGTVDAAGIADNIRRLNAGFSGLRFEVDDIVADGDRVAARWTMRGTHTGEAFGVPASGAQITQSGMVFYRMSGGRAAEQWILVDALGLLQQMGAT